MTDNHYLVPGLQALDKDFEFSILAREHEDAEDGFVDAKERLLDVNNWSRYGNLPEFVFSLKDHHGKQLSRHARKGDAIGISMQGQGSAAWQVIDAIEYDDYPDLDMETFAIRLTTREVAVLKAVLPAVVVLAVDPAVLLMDEPFSALDAQTKMVLQYDLSRTLADTGKTALFVTHDLVEAISLSDRVLVMSQRPGRIIEEIVVDIPDRDNCMERRKSPKIGPYVARLMELLHIDDQLH